MCVLDQKVVESLGLSIFGNSTSTGVGGFSTENTHVKVKSLTVGPMTINNTVFWVHDLANQSLTTRFYQTRLAGLLGYDFFSRAIIALEYDCSGKDKDFFCHGRASIYNPRNPNDLKAVDKIDQGKMVYSPLRFMSKQAHVEAVVKDTGESPPLRSLMCVDLGAGIWMVMNTKNVHAAGFRTCVSDTRIVGGGTGNEGVESEEVPLKYAEIRGMRLGRDGMVAYLVDSFHESSNYVKGLLGMMMFEDCRVVIDYPRKQLGIAPAVKNVKLEETRLKFRFFKT